MRLILSYELTSFLNCLFFIIRNSFFNEFDGACFFIKLFLPHFKYFHLENCRFDSLVFFFCLSSPNSTPQNKHEMAVTVVGLTPRPGCRQWVGILVTLRSCLPTAR